MGYFDDRKELHNALAKLSQGILKKSNPMEREEARLLVSLQDTKRHVQLQGIFFGILVGEFGFYNFKPRESFIFKVGFILIAREFFLYMHMPRFSEALTFINK